MSGEERLKPTAIEYYCKKCGSGPLVLISSSDDEPVSAEDSRGNYKLADIKVRRNYYDVTRERGRFTCIACQVCLL